MDYGNLLGQAWEIIWEHKFLILLGLLVALSGGSRVNFSGTGTGRTIDFQLPSGDRPDFSEAPWDDFSEMPWEGFSEIPGMEDFRIPALPVALAVVVMGLLIILGLILWVIATVARGGLIAGVNDIAVSGVSSFGQAFNAGLGRIWTLLGISLLPAIPALFLGVAGMLSGGLAFLLFSAGSMPAMTGLMGLMGIFMVLACLASPLLIVLNLLRAFANRACMLEDKGIFASYGRGVEVLFANIGPVVVLFIIQIVLSVVVGMLLGASALCCLLWPLLILAQGAIEAYFSTLWTLAWREWTLPAAEGWAR